MVSCSSNEDPIEGNKERTLSYYAGTWDVYRAGIYLTINSDGSITHKSNVNFFDKDETIPATSIKRISDTNFTYSFKNPDKGIGFTNAEIHFYNNITGGVWNYNHHRGEFGMRGRSLYKIQ